MADNDNKEKDLTLEEEFAKINGYVEDLWGRRRRLPDIQLPPFEVKFKDAKTSGNDRYYLLNSNATSGYTATKSVWPGANIKPSNFTSASHIIISHITQEYSEITVDGVPQRYSDQTTNISDRTLPLFGAKLNNSVSANAYSPSGTKCYYAEFISNGIQICNLIPVRKDGVGYMYDRVSGQLFGNSGTGNFILGPDKNS